MSADPVTPDSKAVVLLCSTLGLRRSDSAPTPLSRTEWNDLARTIGASEIKRPGGLFGLTAERLRQILEIPESLATRIVALMDRGGQLSIELERLKSLGIWAITRADEAYPALMKERLKGHAPPVLFGAGNSANLATRGVAIVGSRKVDDEGAAFATQLGSRCGESGLTVFSGGARGVDRIAVEAALVAGGSAVAVLAESLEDTIRHRDTREHVLKGTLTLVTPIHPSTKFSVATAMGRNKLIYALATWAVVVSSDAGTGGTWAGATENLRADWAPLFVRNEASAPQGNRSLIADGGHPIAAADIRGDLQAWLEARATERQPMVVREQSTAYGEGDRQLDLLSGRRPNSKDE